MNAFLDMMSKFTPEANSDSDHKLYKACERGGGDFPSVSTLYVCPICGAGWNDIITAHGMSWIVYTCGYQTAGDLRCKGRHTVYMITGTSVIHIGPMPDEGEDII